MPQCNLLSKYLLPKCPDSEKKCLSSSSSVMLHRRAHISLLSGLSVPAIASRSLGGILAALSEGFLLLSVESLCTLSCYDFFCWLESNSKTLQDVANTDAWARVSQCVLRCKKGMLGRRKNAVFLLSKGKPDNSELCELSACLGAGWVGLGCTFYK